MGSADLRASVLSTASLRSRRRAAWRQPTARIAVTSRMVGRTRRGATRTVNLALDSVNLRVTAVIVTVRGARQSNAGDDVYLRTFRLRGAPGTLDSRRQ